MKIILSSQECLYVVKALPELSQAVKQMNGIKVENDVDGPFTTTITVNTLFLLDYLEIIRKVTITMDRLIADVTGMMNQLMLNWAKRDREAA